MNHELHKLFCKETNQNVVIVKFPNGNFKKYFFDTQQMAFLPLTCSDCFPPQMDTDLSPLQTEWCPHLRSLIIFAYNHVVKMELQYSYDFDSGCFEEIKCLECNSSKGKRGSDPKQIVLVSAGPSGKKPFVLSVNDEGRVVKKCYDEATKMYLDMEPKEIKALTMGPKEEEKEQDIEDPKPSGEVKKTQFFSGAAFRIKEETLPQTMEEKIIKTITAITAKAVQLKLRDESDPFVAFERKMERIKEAKALQKANIAARESALKAGPSSGKPASTETIITVGGKETKLGPSDSAQELIRNWLRDLKEKQIAGEKLPADMVQMTMEFRATSPNKTVMPSDTKTTTTTTASPTSTSKTPATDTNPSSSDDPTSSDTESVFVDSFEIVSTEELKEYITD